MCGMSVMTTNCCTAETTVVASNAVPAYLRQDQDRMLAYHMQPTNTMGTNLIQQYQQQQCQGLKTPYDEMERLAAQPEVQPKPQLQPNLDLRELTYLNGLLVGVQQEQLSAVNRHHELKQRMEGLEFEQDEDHELVISQGKMIKILQDKVKLLSQLVIKQDNDIATVRNKAKAQEAKQLRCNIKIMGLDVRKDSTLLEDAKDFFKESMEITQDIKITSAYRFRTGDPPPTGGETS